VVEAEAELRAVNARIEEVSSDYKTLEELLLIRVEAEKCMDKLLEFWPASINWPRA